VKLKLGGKKKLKEKDLPKNGLHKKMWIMVNSHFATRWEILPHPMDIIAIGSLMGVSSFWVEWHNIHKHSNRGWNPSCHLGMNLGTLTLVPFLKNSCPPYLTFKF